MQLYHAPLVAIVLNPKCHEHLRSLHVEARAVAAAEGCKTALRAKPEAVEIDDVEASWMRRLGGSLDSSSVILALKRPRTAMASMSRKRRARGRRRAAYRTGADTRRPDRSAFP